MDSVNVNLPDLLSTLKTNRDKHRDNFLIAQDVYRKLVITELDKMLADARSGGNIYRHVNLRAPVDHTQDYDKLIGLLQMSVDQNIRLNTQEYWSYVKDNWSWAADNVTNNTYRNISPMFVGEDASLSAEAYSAMQLLKEHSSLPDSY